MMEVNNKNLLKKPNCFPKKKIFLLALGLFLFLNLIIIFSLASEGQQNFDFSERTPETITIASEPDYPPYCIVDENGNPDGFSIELFKEVANRVNLDVQIKIGIWNEIKQDLAEGKIDALPLVGRTPGREELFDFTLPYLSLHGAVFVRKETEYIKSIEDLKDKSIGVMRGDNAEEFVRRENISNQIHTTNTFEEAFKKLAGGEYDAVITQRVMGLHLLDEMGIESVKVLDLQLPEFRQDFCFAVQKGDEELLSRLNEGLSIIIADGTYNSIRLKWFGPQAMEEIPLNRILTIALHVFFPLFLIFLLASIFILRKQIKKRTSNLKAEIKEHKKTLDILQKQQLLLKEMEKISKIGGWEYDVKTGTVNCTDGVYEIYGVPREENPLISYEASSSFYLPAARDKLDIAFQKALETGEPYDLVLEFKSSDGTKKWVRTIGKSEMENGKVKRLYGNII